MDADAENVSYRAMQERALQNMRDARIKQDRELHQELLERKAPLMEKLSELRRERSRLENLVRKAVDDVDAKLAEMERIEGEHRDRLRQIDKERQEENESRRDFFRAHLGSAADIWLSAFPSAAGDHGTDDAMDVDQAPPRPPPRRKVPVRTKLPSAAAVKGNGNGNGNGNGTAHLPVLAPAPVPTIEEPPPEERMGRSSEPVSMRGGFTPVNARSVANSPSSRDASATRSEKNLSSTVAKPPRRSLPEGRLSSKAMSPFNRRPAKSPVASEAGTPRAEESDAAPDIDMDLPDITRAGLSLEHDGTVYTAPEIMVGVPLERVDENHEYWESSWKPMRAKFEEQFRNFEAKHIALKSGESLAEDDDIKPSTKKNTQMQIGRQVNRGRTLMEFFKDDTQINPYQLVAKRFITAGFCNYDTIFRLVSTLDELKKFSLDVTPLEWIRQRLWEIYCEDRQGFQLNRIVHNFYRDPKLSSLRAKAGFGNIGRPFGGSKTGGGGGGGSGSTGGGGGGSGTKVRKSTGGGDGSERDTPVRKGRGKRKELHGATLSGANSPGDAASSRRASESGDSVAQDAAPDDEAPHERASSGRQVKTEDGGSPPNNNNKRPRIEYAELEPSGSDLEYDGYTTTEELSEDKLLPTDWEVEEVKSAERTTTTDASTYWHWVEVADGKSAPYLEHQVLAGTDPTVWSCYKGFDFSLRPAELKEVLFAPGSSYVFIRKYDHAKGNDGHLVAQFARTRTRKRFLKFLGDKGVKVVKTDADYVKSAWDSFKPKLGPEGPLEDMGEEED